MQKLPSNVSRLLLITALLALLFAFAPPPVQADDPIQVISQSVGGDLSKSIQFTVRVKSLKGNVVAGRLVANFPGLNPTPHDVAPDSAGTEVTLHYNWDISRLDEPPWELVLYHWEITNSSGQKIATAQASGEITDASREWKKLTDGQVSVYYYDQPDAFGKSLLKATQAGYNRVGKATGHIPQYEIRVVIYSNHDDFCSYHVTQGCLQWVGGETDAGITVQYLDPDNDPNNKAMFNQTIPHELAHAFLHEWLGANSIAMTRWFDEGQAVNNQIEGVDFFLKRAVGMAKSNRLIRVRQMGLPVLINPNNTDKIYDWYAEATSLVKFLFDHWGTDSLGKIVADLSKGKTFETALKNVTGANLDEYEVQWKTWLGVPDALTPTPKP